MFKIYVDDENQLWRVMEMGRKWNGRKMEWREEWEEMDMIEREKGEKDDMRMMREVQKMANTIEKDIRLTIEVPNSHPDGKLPVLDLKMWLESRRDGEGGTERQGGRA